MSTKTIATPPAYHFFASNAFAWGVGLTRDEAIANCARGAGADLIKTNVKAHGGMYVWSCRVDVPKSTQYDIANYRPEGVPISTGRHHHVLNVKGEYRGAPITEHQQAALDAYPHLVQALRDCLQADAVSSDELNTMIKNVLARAGVVL